MEEGEKSETKGVAGRNCLKHFKISLCSLSLFILSWLCGSSLLPPLTLFLFLYQWLNPAQSLFFGLEVSTVTSQQAEVAEVQFKCSAHVCIFCMGSPWVLWLPFTVQRHAVNWWFSVKVSMNGCLSPCASFVVNWWLVWPAMPAGIGSSPLWPWYG